MLMELGYREFSSKQVLFILNHYLNGEALDIKLLTQALCMTYLSE